MTKKEAGKKKTRAFSTPGYGEKENAFPIRIKENSKYMQCCHSLFCLHNTTHCNVTLKMFVEHFSVGKLNITICHCQINENASSYIIFFNIKSKFYTLGACMRTVIDSRVHLRSAGINQLQQQKVRETRNKVTEKTIRCDLICIQIPCL